MTTGTKRACRAWAAETRDWEMETFGPDLNAAVVAAVRSSSLFRRARVVASYAAFGSEIDLSELVGEEGKRFVFPRTHSRPEPRLTLHEAPAPDSEGHPAWERHRFGQLEPGVAQPLVAPHEVDLFLVPGLAFDPSGTRLGYGKGFYDRLLPLARPGAALVGITIDALVLPELPRLAHDVRVGYLATESGLRETLRVSSHDG